MATPPPPGPSKRKFTDGLLPERFKRPRPNLQLPSAGAGSVASSAPSAVSTSPSSPATPGSSAIIPPALTPVHNVSGAGPSTASTSTGSGQVSAMAQTPTGAKSSGMVSKLKHRTVTGLESALQALHISAGAIPGLKPAVGGLIDCLDVVQAATSSTEEYDEITSNLNMLAAGLKEYLCELGLKDPSGDPACALIASNIEKEVEHIKKQQDRNRLRRALESIEDKEDVVRCFRRVEGLFQQLQSTICLQILRNTNKQHLKSLRDSLRPASDARYNSSYATTVKRRGCTKETREQVQETLQEWIQDPNGAKVFWMNGMAGTGKTTIAYSLCEWLETEKLLGASFFCSRVSSLCRNASSILPTIAYELARSSSEFRVELGKVLEDDLDARTLGVVRQFEKLIQGPMMAVKGTMPNGLLVVIDALDECEDGDSVKLMLEVLLRRGIGLPLKWFVTSRPEITTQYEKLGTAEHPSHILQLHDIEQSIVKEDIKKYLKEALAPMSSPPDTEQINQLAKLAGKLFIYAATIARYILPRTTAADSTGRLETIIATGTRVTNEEGTKKKYKQLDNLYTEVLRTAFEEEGLEEEDIKVMQLVLWTVVCARESMTIPTLSSFLSLSEGRISSVVQPLLSVLHVSGQGRLVSTLHASFPNYILDHSRSDEYFCDPLQHSALLARYCFDIMKAKLRFNICDFESSFDFDEEVADLEERIERNIAPELCYACYYWGEHLHGTGPSDELYSELFYFLALRLLFWMEVLNVKRHIVKGVSIISEAEKWVLACDYSTHKQLVADVKEFLAKFAAGACGRSTPHIYISAIPFCVQSHYVYALYWAQTRGLIHVEGTATSHRSGGALATWKTYSYPISLALSPDGKRIVSIHEQGEIQIRDTRTGNILLSTPMDDIVPESSTQLYSIADPAVRPFKGHTNEPMSVTFSPDGTRIASGSYGKTIQVWDAYTGIPVAEPFEGHEDAVASVVFFLKGTRIASGSHDSTVRVWDVSTGKTIAPPFTGHTGNVNSVAVSPTDTYVASGSADRTVRLWDWSTGNMVAQPLRGHTNEVNVVAFSPSGTLIASGSTDCTILLWNPSTCTIVGRFLHESRWGVKSVAFSPNGARIASASACVDASIQIWETYTSNPVARPFRGHQSSITSVIFSPDGTCIISGSEDSIIRVWNVNDNIATTWPSQGHTARITAAIFSPSGTHIASCSSDKTVRIWDAYTGNITVRPFVGHTDEIESIAFSPDGARLVSGSRDRTLLLWDTNTGGTLFKPFIGHTKAVLSVGFSPNGAFVASGSEDCTVILWDTQTGNSIVSPLVGHTGPVNSVAFSPDSKRVASGSRDRTIRVWDISTGDIVAEPFLGHTHVILSVAFSPDGSRIVSSSADLATRLWDLGTGTASSLSYQVKKGIGYIDCLALSPDGAHIATAEYCSHDEQDTISLWEIHTGNMVAGPFYGHTNHISSVAFSPDGTRLVSGSADGVIRVWDLNSDAEDLVPDDDGWFTSEGCLLFWAPLDFHSRVPQPRNSLLIAPEGTVSIDYDSILVGNEWAGCYKPGS